MISRYYSDASTVLQFEIIIVKQVLEIKDVIPPPLRREFCDVYIATELMDTDLHQIIRSNQDLLEEHCQVPFFSCVL